MRHHLNFMLYGFCAAPKHGHDLHSHTRHSMCRANVLWSSITPNNWQMHHPTDEIKRILSMQIICESNIAGLCLYSTFDRKQEENPFSIIIIFSCIAVHIQQITMIMNNDNNHFPCACRTTIIISIVARDNERIHVSSSFCHYSSS